MKQRLRKWINSLKEIDSKEHSEGLISSIIKEMSLELNEIEKYEKEKSESCKAYPGRLRKCKMSIKSYERTGGLFCVWCGREL